MNVQRKSSLCINVEGAMSWDNGRVDSRPDKYAYTKQASSRQQGERRVSNPNFDDGKQNHARSLRKQSIQKRRH